MSDLTQFLTKAYGIPQEIITKVTVLVRDFIWKGKQLKVALATLHLVVVGQQVAYYDFCANLYVVYDLFKVADKRQDTIPGFFSIMYFPYHFKESDVLRTLMSHR